MDNINLNITAQVRVFYEIQVLTTTRPRISTNGFFKFVYYNWMWNEAETKHQDRVIKYGRLSGLSVKRDPKSLSRVFSALSMSRHMVT